MKIRPTGVSLPAGFGFQWEFVPGDKEVARKAIIYLENRRVLRSPRELGDEKECVRSAIQIRNRLTKLITAAQPGGGLEGTLRAMRTVCTEFVTKAGPDATRFRGLHGEGNNVFGDALRELRSLMGIHIAIIVNKYNFDVEEELTNIFPREDDDLSWLPGFGGN